MTYCEVEKAISELAEKCGEEITFRRDTGEYANLFELYEFTDEVLCEMFGEKNDR